MTAELMSVKETTDLRQEVASVIDLPDAKDRQPDLAYFTSRFVSTGTNLNDAHFLGSEIVSASKTVSGKAVDIEHEEDKIIGHIYRHEYTDNAGNKIDKEELTKQEIAKLDAEDMHIEIASVIYKTRFPEVAEEIKNGEWKVSMEAYFTSYDILVGNTILTLDEARLMGFDTSNENLYGKAAKIVKSGNIIDEGKVARVLRGICFSGVGIVKNPANPPSIIFESASDEDEVTEIILDQDALDEATNKVTSSKIDNEDASLEDPTTVGICVSYHNELNDSVVKDQDSKVIKKQWCSKYDMSCPVYGDQTDPECIRFTSGDMVWVSASEVYSITQINNIVAKKLDDLDKDSKITYLVEHIELLLEQAKNVGKE
jgi:hypothetical protein